MFENCFKLIFWHSSLLRHTLLNARIRMTQPAKVINRGLYYMLYLIQNRWALIANHDGENKSLDEMLNSKKSLLQNNNYKQNSYWVARTMYIHIKGKAETIVGPEM